VAKELPVHNDILSRPVSVDDTVAFSNHNSLEIGRIVKVTNKQIRVVPLLGRYSADFPGYLKYSSQCVLVGGPDLTMWMLKTG
jgi:hypothetical protein